MMRMHTDMASENWRTRNSGRSTVRERVGTTLLLISYADAMSPYQITLGPLELNRYTELELLRRGL